LRKVGGHFSLPYDIVIHPSAILLCFLSINKRTSLLQKAKKLLIPLKSHQPKLRNPIIFSELTDHLFQIKHAISKVIVHLLCVSFAHSSKFAFFFLLPSHKTTPSYTKAQQNIFAMFYMNVHNRQGKYVIKT
jgi:hypothetical protein